eukprot:COSAG01_NODE_33491_length_563_cov_0.920259_1_plen_28_part_10
MRRSFQNAEADRQRRENEDYAEVDRQRR